MRRIDIRFVLFVAGCVSFGTASLCTPVAADTEPKQAALPASVPGLDSTGSHVQQTETPQTAQPHVQQTETPQTAQPHVQPGLAPNARQQILPVPLSNRPSDRSLTALVSEINLTGWNPSQTRVFYAGSAPLVPDDVEALPLAKFEEPDQQKMLILVELHCRSIVWRLYQRGQRRIIVQVYSFENSAGAYGAYNLLRHGASTVVIRGDASSEDDQSISFCKDREFVVVYGTSEDDEESKEAVRSIADQIGSAITGHGQLPSIVGHIPGLERVRGSEKLVMGPVSARRFFPAPYIGSLSFDRAKLGVVADYQISSPFPERLKLLCVQYADPPSAARAYDQYMMNLQSEKRINDEDASGGTLVKIERGYLFSQVHGDEIVIVSGARKKYSPGMLARQVY